MKNRDRIVAFLGPGTSFEGALSFEGTVRIDGRFKGEISSPDTLIVGEGAVIEADIHVGSLLASGEIRGQIFAEKRIEIQRPGRVFGNLQATAIVIDEGVLFEGETRMVQAPRPAPPDAPAVELRNPEAAAGAPAGSLIFGRIIDKSSGKPVVDALISAKARGFDKRETRTDGSGFYEFRDVADGAWKMKCKAKGFRTVKAALDIRHPGKYEENFDA